MIKKFFYYISFLILFISIITNIDNKYNKFYNNPYKYKDFLNLYSNKINMISIMSYNIRNLYLDLNSKQNWNNRKEKLLNNILLKSPDILSIQEDTLEQINFLNNNLKNNYSYFNLIDPNNDKKMNHNSIFYNKLKYSFIYGEYFWLNSNNSYNKTDWDAWDPRSATIIILKNIKTKTHFIIVNAHLDHMGKKARREGIKIVLNRIEEINKDKNYPVFLMGDFNESPNHYAYYEVMKKNYNDTWSDCVYNKNIVCLLGEQYATSFHFYFGKKINNIFIRNFLYIVYYFHGGKNSFYNRYHIDHMYYKNNKISKIYPLYNSFPSDDLIDNKDGVYASDHFPIFSVFNFDYNS